MAGEGEDKRNEEPGHMGRIGKFYVSLLVGSVQSCAGRLCRKEVFRVIFSIYYQVSGNSLSVTNLRLLSEETGIGRDKLSTHFTRKKKKFFNEKGIIIIRTDELRKGAHRWS